LDSAPGAPGFWICNVSVAVVCTSAGFRAVAQLSAVEHVVPRATPFTRIVDPDPPLPATKFRPWTSSGKLSTAPAITLEGKIRSIRGPLEITIVDEADFVVSAWLVAVIRIELGEGAAVGAVYSPLALTDPQAAPPQPCPATPLWTLHATLVSVVPITFAKNCNVLGVPDDGATIANTGLMVTVTGPELPVTSTIAIPDLEGSALLTAVSVTGFVAGGEAGARKSIAAGLGPAGATHGFEPATQTWPTLKFPLATPDTSQVTPKSGVFITLGVNVIRWFRPTDADAGETETVTLLVIVTAAEATGEPLVTVLAVACTVTVFGTGRSAGAVYTAVLAPDGEIVPRVAVPPTIPFTSQVIVAAAARQNVATKFCVVPRPTLAEEGASELVAAQVIVAVALPAFVPSATLVAVTVTVGADGTTGGAV